jgi:hypothetical protein
LVNLPFFEKSFNFPFSSLTTNNQSNKFDLKIVQNGKTFNCLVERDEEDKEFEVKINGEAKLKIKDNIKLNEHIIRAKINKEELTMQLISKLSNGEINLQYLGTKVILVFLYRICYQEFCYHIFFSIVQITSLFK